MRHDIAYGIRTPYRNFSIIPNKENQRIIKMIHSNDKQIRELGMLFLIEEGHKKQDVELIYYFFKLKEISDIFCDNVYIEKNYGDSMYVKWYFYNVGWYNTYKEIAIINNIINWGTDYDFTSLLKIGEESDDIEEVGLPWQFDIYLIKSIDF